MTNSAVLGAHEIGSTCRGLSTSAASSMYDGIGTTGVASITTTATHGTAHAAAFARRSHPTAC
jgi:hypothetical protein